MRSVPKPNLLVDVVYDACVSGVGDDDKKNRFKDFKNNILASAIDYENKANNSDIYQIIPVGKIVSVPLVTKSELKKLYENQMAKKGRPGRGYYETLKASVKMCPFCGISSIRGLEHYMPKAHYPNLSIVPLNLIPCCRDCNTEKHDTKIETIENQNIHPYFDDFTKEQWLFADIIYDNEPVAIFRVTPPAAWDIKSKHKVNNHLTTYDLDERFGDLASEEISGIKKTMTELLSSTNSNIVRQDLLDAADSHAAVRKNSWQVALYQALANSPLYCSGNFG